jgi:hypothetical protein
VKKTRQNKKLEPPFRFNRNGKGSSQTKPQGMAIKPSNGLGRMADFARVTANLQGQRHQADYEPSQTFTDTEAKLAISEARQAIAWFNSCDDEQQKAFLTMLLFRPR